MGVLWLYLSALLFGFGTFAIQMLFSSESGGDADAPGPSELAAGDAAAELSAPAGTALDDLGPEPGTHVEVHSGGGSAAALADWASIFTSLRFYMLACIGLGLVGTPVTWLGLASPLSTLIASAVTALLVGAAGSWVFRALGRDTLSSGATRSDLMGQVGRVLIACEKGRRGKVRLHVRGQLVDYLATTDEPRLAPGTAIIVQEVAVDSLVVCEAPRELAAAWGERGAS